MWEEREACGGSSGVGGDGANKDGNGRLSIYKSLSAKCPYRILSISRAVLTHT